MSTSGNAARGWRVKAALPGSVALAPVVHSVAKLSNASSSSTPAELDWPRALPDVLTPRCAGAFFSSSNASDSKSPRPSRRANPAPRSGGRIPRWRFGTPGYFFGTGPRDSEIQGHGSGIREPTVLFGTGGIPRPHLPFFVPSGYRRGSRRGRPRAAPLRASGRISPDASLGLSSPRRPLSRSFLRPVPVCPWPRTSPTPRSRASGHVGVVDAHRLDFSPPFCASSYDPLTVSPGSRLVLERLG